MVPSFLSAFCSLEPVDPSLSIREGTWVLRIEALWPSDSSILLALVLADQSGRRILNGWCTWISDT